MFTDMVGYTALTQSNESQAMEVLQRHNQILRPLFPKFRGREVKSIGDSFLVEFDSALDATSCAVEIQRILREYNASAGDGWKINLRIGVHLGDVIHAGDDVFGDAVNIASRLEPLAEPGGICVSDQVFGQVRNKIPEPLEKLAPHDLKNVSFAVDVYKVVMPWEQHSSTPQYPAHRVAILPFASFSVDPSDGFFADGMTEEVISTVSGISGLDVISRTSVMGYKGTTKKVEEIGRELKVGTVLEGSFRKAGNRVRITTQLIDVTGDRHLWAENYDRELDDVFAVQSDIAKQVAEALRVRIRTSEMTRIERKPTDSTAAYSHYLRGRALMYKRGLDEIKAAKEAFMLSVGDDPAFALGYAGIADCCLLLRNNFGLDRKRNLEEAKVNVSKSLDLDPGLAESHATNGLMLAQAYDPSQAEKEYKKAVELRPSYATAHQWYFQLLESELRLAEAEEHIEKALELDPLSPVINQNYGNFCLHKRDYPRALEFYRRSMEMGYIESHGMMSMAYGRMQMYDDMKREGNIWLEYASKAFPHASIAAECFYAYMMKDYPALRRLLPQLEAHLSESSFDSMFVASAYFVLGDVDAGFSWLERAYSEGVPFQSIQIDEDYDNVRSDPRYLDILNRVGLG